MLFVKKVFLAIPLLATALASDLSTDSTNSVVPVSGKVMVAAQATSGDTRIYYQANNGSIVQIAVSNAFTVGQFESTHIEVPPDEVRYNTLLLSQLPPKLPSSWSLHIFFFSPDNILSEYFFNGSSFEGGPTCATCITNEGFVGAEGSQMLAGSPETISEAVNTGSGWSVASLTT
ncbi:hypothetical protein BDP27DRAFT_1428588 [Rhodocollybia butyracea]|uniref:Uncharacterized protein n=1 Tax=Rhodocollybia butyracea TaxID=206335 RepID=A0A9P5PFN8_9AGAR|nr:hypothetical protein BDP27DRAFT_1428588 [Rhodocollybia butyracea]